MSASGRPSLLDISSWIHIRARSTKALGRPALQSSSSRSIIMVRIPRRTHSVSGPPSVHCVLKDIACCCNMVKIHDFYMAMMALRRNPHRKCKREIEPIATAHDNGNLLKRDRDVEQRVEPPHPPMVARCTPRKPQHRSLSAPTTLLGPFRFFELPREVRDHVYSYLVVRRGRRTPIIEAKSIIRDQKKRASTQRTRDRLNLKRAQTGRQPIAPREPTTDPIIQLNVLQASKLLHYEATDCLYQQNWFAISIDNLPAITFETPLGWDYARITKLQLELQLKDAQRMNSYIDWTPFFAAFPALRFLRIIPTFHSRYYDWVSLELGDWSNAHYVLRAFFRELMASVPERLILKLGPSADSREDMHLEGKAAVKRQVLWDMYVELGMRRESESGSLVAVSKVVDCCVTTGVEGKECVS